MLENLSVSIYYIESLELTKVCMNMLSKITKTLSLAKGVHTVKNKGVFINEKKVFDTLKNPK